MNPTNDRGRLVGIAGAFALAIGVFSTPANADLVGTYILETQASFDAEAFGLTLDQDLILRTGGGPGPDKVSASGARDTAQSVNEALSVFNNVDQVVAFEVGGGNEVLDDEGPFTSAAIDVTQDGDMFQWTLEENAESWNIIKVGIKVSNHTAFFLVDPFEGSDSGTIDVSELIDLYPVLEEFWTSGPDPETANDQELSNISFFGQQTNNVPEPGTLALFGIGLIGMGLVARRRKAQ